MYKAAVSILEAAASYFHCNTLFILIAKKINTTKETILPDSLLFQHFFYPSFMPPIGLAFYFATSRDSLNS